MLFFDKQSPGAVPFTRSFSLLVTVFTTATLTRDDMNGGNIVGMKIVTFLISSLMSYLNFLIDYSKELSK